jgi:hypothetical protein
MTIHSHATNQVNFPNHSEKKVGTTKYLAKFQGPRAIIRSKIIEPKLSVHLICNLSLYTHMPNIKSIYRCIVKKCGDNCFISELRSDGHG